jgi:serine/threonine-protein kinase RIO1
MNNSDTLRLLASIELACYRCKQALLDPRLHTKSRRKIERVIKDDRRKRHRRRKDQDSMIDAFARQSLSNDTSSISAPVPSHSQNDVVAAPLIGGMSTLVVSEETPITTS